MKEDKMIKEKPAEPRRQWRIAWYKQFSSRKDISSSLLRIIYIIVIFIISFKFVDIRMNHELGELNIKNLMKIQNDI